MMVNNIVPFNKNNNNNSTNKKTTMKTSSKSILLVVLVALLMSTANGQYDYDPGQEGGDYGSDNLYHDYAMRQQEKEVGKP